MLLILIPVMFIIFFVNFDVYVVTCFDLPRIPGTIYRTLPLLALRGGGNDIAREPTHDATIGPGAENVDSSGYCRDNGIAGFQILPQPHSQASKAASSARPRTSGSAGREISIFVVAGSPI